MLREQEAAAVFDILNETAEKTNLQALKARDRVNLERALKAGDRLSGHFVTGHIDCAARITRKGRGPGDLFIGVKIPGDYLKFVVNKGSIALDGISLTVGRLEKDEITVFLIPHTVNSTTLGFKKPGDFLNIEFDILGKYGLNRPAADQPPSNITRAFLKSKGF